MTCCYLNRLIHRSAWKVNSANFNFHFTAFSEVGYDLPVTWADLAKLTLPSPNVGRTDHRRDDGSGYHQPRCRVEGRVVGA
jgi:hypothetical protein